MFAPMDIEVKNITTKHVLLLVPGNLATVEPLLELMLISKKAKSIDYKVFSLERKIVQHRYSYLPEAVLNFLYPFCVEGLHRNTQQAKEKLKLQRAGINRDQFLYNARLRYLSEAFEGFKPFYKLVSWYHKVPVHKGKFTLSPCSFSKFKPQLSFEVNKRKKLLELQVIV